MVATSQTGEVLRIKAAQFLQYIKNDSEAWNKFTMQCLLKEKQFAKRIHVFQQNFNSKKVEFKKTNLLDQRKKNIATNIGELDVRHSFDNVIKTMDARSPSSNDEYLSRRSFTFQKTTNTSVETTHRKGKITFKNSEIKPAKENKERYLSNSPSST